MPSLDDHFRALTKIRTPADWPWLDVLESRLETAPSDLRPQEKHRLRRRPAPGQRHPLMAAAVAFAVAAAGIGFAVWVFEGTPEPPKPGPAATVENGKIAFVVGDSPRYEIFTLNPDGTELMKLADGRDPAWSPDGSGLAFTIQRPGLGIAVMNADGTGVTELIDDHAYAQSPSWSPDATRIAFSAQNGIYVMNADGTDVRRVDGYSGPLACADFEPSWSPDGATIAWAVRCDGGGLGIWTVRPDGSRRSILVDEGSGLWTFNHPSWSPDGNLLAFEGGRPVFGDAPGPVAEMGVYVVDADGSGLTKLADGTEPAWSPDGTMIAFVRDRDLFVVDKDGGQVTQVTSDRLVSLGPSWQPVPVDDGAPTPEPTTIPEGTITLPAGAIPEGTLLVNTNAGAEVLQVGSARSGSVPGVRFPLDLSPDGSTVLGLTGGQDMLGDLIAVDLLTGEGRVLVRPAGDDVLGAFAQWSPDGSMVAYSVGAGDPADRSTVCVLVLASGEPSCFPGVERVYTFDWAPSGGRLVVAGPPVQPVRILDVETGGVTDVVPQEGDTVINNAIREAGMGTSFQLVGPTWSPSGTYLAALANLEDSKFSYVPVVFTPDGRFVAFGRASGEYPEPFEWSPVADVIAYTRGEAPYRITEAYLLDPASGEERALVSGHDTDRSFVLNDMAWAPSGRWLAIAGWEDFGEGRFQTSFRVLNPADPASLEQFSVDTGDNFIADWGL